MKSPIEMVKKIPQVLLWGGNSLSRIFHDLMIKDGIGNPVIIFDDKISVPHYDSNAIFINNIDQLIDSIKLISHFVVCIGSEHGYARYKTAEALQKLNLKPLSIIHKTSYTEISTKLGYGSIILQGAIIN